jgi:two-component system sensor histidine kinase CpxA
MVAVRIMILFAFILDLLFEAGSRRARVTVVAPEVCMVLGDAEDLRSALENIVRNAVQFTEEGSTVDARLTADQSAVSIAIEDHGSGVPEHLLPRLLEPFFRVEEARERSPGGAGVGLAIASRVLRLHGGSIVARNRSGGGLAVLAQLRRFPEGYEHHA